MRYTIFITERTGDAKAPILMTKRFEAVSVDITTAGVWTHGHWHSEDPRKLQEIFFPMHRVKYIIKVNEYEAKRDHSKPTADPRNR